MNPDTQDFHDLRRLLALKRHEQPPPGYFHYFSRQIIVRIKAGDRGQQATWIETLFAETAWLQRVWAAFETRPALVGAFGALVCGFLISGVIYSQGGTSDSQGPTVADIFQPVARPTVAIVAEPMRASSSIEPMLFPQSRGPFDGAQFQPASFLK
jgi:hypothetical protein